MWCAGWRFSFDGAHMKTQSPQQTRDVDVPTRLQSPTLLLVLLALWLVATLGLRPLLLPDEGRYASVAYEMLMGNALVPTLNGLPFFHKPPLFYWLDMTAMQLFGINAFAARASSMLGAWLMGISLFLAMRRWHGPRVAALALGVLATCPFFFIGAQYANHDMLVAGLITVAVLSLAVAVEQSPRVHLGWLLMGSAACALAMLAKGLIGFVLPVLVVGPWLLAQGRWRQLIGLLHPLGLLVFFAIAAPWFVLTQIAYPDFFDYFFVEQHFRRYAQSSFNNVQPFWFYFALLPALMLPWSAWLPQAFRRAWTARDSRVGLYVWWVIAIVVFFSLPSSKLAGYVLPAAAPWCALLTLAIARGSTRLWQWVLAGSAVLCLVLVAVIAWQAPKSSRAAALVLASRMAPNDKVVMIDEYFYDLPFYARLKKPVIIASDWADPDLALRDNWRKELFDATRFAPVLGAEILRPLDSLDKLLCGQVAVWFVVHPKQAERLDGLAGITREFANTNVELWRAPAHACP